MNSLPVTNLDLALAASTLILLAYASARLKLGVGRQTLVAGARMVLQLFLLGAILKGLFQTKSWAPILAIAMIMTAVAGREVMARVTRPLRGIRKFAIGAASMALASFALAAFALLALIQPQPWYQPQYAIPLLGMLLGNTMTAVAITMDRLTDGLWKQQSVIDQRLALGETPRVATSSLMRESVRAGLIPVVNAMAVAGIVSLPGMMTGQILAGAAPDDAVRYQILIWALIGSGSGFGAILGAKLTIHRMFDGRARLRLDRVEQPR